MDTLKLNKIVIYVFLYIIFLSCQNDKEKCDCEKVVYIGSELTFNYKEYGNIKGLKIQHIRNGKIIENISWIYIKEKKSYIKKTKIEMNSRKDLYRTDSIVFLFKNGKKIILHGFIVEPYYRGKFFGGQEFVGCSTKYCKFNDEDSVYIGNGIKF